MLLEISWHKPTVMGTACKRQSSLEKRERERERERNRESLLAQTSNNLMQK